MQHLHRRDFLRGRTTPPPAPMRPPWIAEDALSTCNSCSACVESCPEHIISFDDANRPKLSFETNGCTFCGDCAAACPEDVFNTDLPARLPYTPKLAATCLLTSGVSCQVCTDFCDTEALWFDLSQRPVGAVMTTSENCTGCGMCISACPVQAIALVPNTESVAA